MNIEKFKWPAIIAASLHGALFLNLPSTTVTAGTGPTTITKPWTPPPGPVEPPIAVDLNDPEDEPQGSTAGGPEPLPAGPELPPPERTDHPITIPVEPYSTRTAVDTARIGPSWGNNPLGPDDGSRIGPGTRIINATQLDKTPRAMAQESPRYPDGMRNAGIDGRVAVEFLVDTAGRVISAEAVNWTHREFVDPAVRAVLRWRFEPGMKDGRKVRFRMTVPIEFRATL